MGRKKLIASIIILLIFLLLPFFVSAEAQEQEYKDYTVVKGDTLWDISGKEFRDPFLWPKIWKENPEIPNPDRIYPNQRIRIPLYILQKEIPLAEIPETKVEVKKEEPKKEIGEKIEPIKTMYLVDRDLIMSCGYITDSVHSVGKVVGSPSGRDLLGKDDHAYIETQQPTKIGDRFYAMRSLGEITHPKTGYKLGYLIEVLGIVEVVGQDNNETKAKITVSPMDIVPGDLLENYYEIEPPFAIENPRRPDTLGYIVATKQLRTLNGMFDIVYIDKGKTDGLEVGDVLATALLGKQRVINGVIQIINLKASTATAIVRKSNNVVSRGDGVLGLK